MAVARQSGYEAKGRADGRLRGRGAAGAAKGRIPHRPDRRHRPRRSEAAEGCGGGAGAVDVGRGRTQGEAGEGEAGRAGSGVAAVFAREPDVDEASAGRSGDGSRDIAIHEQGEIELRVKIVLFQFFFSHLTFKFEGEELVGGKKKKKKKGEEGKEMFFKFDLIHFFYFHTLDLFFYTCVNPCKNTSEYVNFLFLLFSFFSCLLNPMHLNIFEIKLSNKY